MSDVNKSHDVYHASRRTDNVVRLGLSRHGATPSTGDRLTGMGTRRVEGGYEQKETVVPFAGIVAVSDLLLDHQASKVDVDRLATSDPV